MGFVGGTGSLTRATHSFLQVVPEQEVQSTDSEDELTDSDDEMVEADSQASGAEPKVLDAHGLALGTMMLKKKVHI